MIKGVYLFLNSTKILTTFCCLPSGVSHLGLRFLVKSGILRVVAPSAIPDNWKNKSIFNRFLFVWNNLLQRRRYLLYQCKLKLPDFYKLTKNQIAKCQLMSKWKSKRKFFTSMVNLKFFSMEIRQKLKFLSILDYLILVFKHYNNHRTFAVWWLYDFSIHFRLIRL